MIQLFEFTFNQAMIIAMALPVVAICLFILIIPSLKKGSSSKLRRYLSYLVKPPHIGSLESASQSIDNEGRSAALWREI